MSHAFPGELPRPDPPHAPPQQHAFEFTGPAGEFFRIWIVNVALTLLTLGIYSAWAKVRTSRWFAAHTHLAGASFEYHAEPIAILKGRLLVVAFLLVYAVSSIVPPIQAMVGVAIAIAVPWAIGRSLKFKARYTSWRNIRFAFGGTYGEAFVAYLVMPFVGVLTLGIMYPYAVFAQRRFMVDNAAFGTTRFCFGSTPGQFYAAFAVLSAIGLAMLVLVGVAAGVIGASTGDGEGGRLAGLAFGLAFIPLYFVVFAAWSAQISNLTYDGAELGPHRLSCHVPILGLAWVQASNALAIVTSLGLLYPWSKVRVARFRLSFMELTARDSLETFAAVQGEDVGALGTEFGQAFDVDLGL